MTNEEKKQRIEGFRKIIKPFIAKELQKINYEGMGVIDKTEFESDFEVILTLAESALEQQPCPYWDYKLETCRHANIGALATKPCENAVEVWDGIHCQIVAPKGTFDKIYNDAEENEKAINREDAIKVIKSWFEKIELNPDILIDSIISLPSVTPIRPKGEWEYDKTIQNWRCSKCHETPKTLGYVGTKEFMTEHFKFCNHCSADMRGETDAT